LAAPGITRTGEKIACAGWVVRTCSAAALWEAKSCCSISCCSACSGVCGGGGGSRHRFPFGAAATVRGGGASAACGCSRTSADAGGPTRRGGGGSSARGCSRTSAEAGGPTRRGGGASAAPDCSRTSADAGGPTRRGGEAAVAACAARDCSAVINGNETGLRGGGKIRAGNALDLATSGGGPATASALGIAFALVTAGAFGICVAVESPAEAPAATTEGSEASVGRSWSSKVAGVGVGAGSGVGAGAGNT
jgi:hypothetical protein